MFFLVLFVLFAWTFAFGLFLDVFGVSLSCCLFVFGVFSPLCFRSFF